MNSRMTILICTGIFPPEAGGPATYSELLAAAFSEQGHEVCVITYSDQSKVSGDERYPFQLVRITRSWLKPWHYFKYFRAALRFARQADVVYAQDPVSSGFPAMRAARKLGKPFVLKITGDYSWEQAASRGLTNKLIDDFQKLNSFTGPIQRIRDVQIRVSRSADRVVVPSEYLKSLVKGWGVASERIEVVYNSVPKIPDLDREEIRQSFGLGADDFLVVSAGRDVPWKGFESLQKAVSDLKSDRPEISLKILTNRSRSEVMKHVKAADVFVLSSSYEGFSHMLLEAMELGTPIIATRVGGNLELIRDGENGLLVEYGNENALKRAIIKLYEQRDLGEKLAETGRRDVEKTAGDLTAQAMTSKTLEILRQCAS